MVFSFRSLKWEETKSCPKATVFTYEEDEENCVYNKILTDVHITIQRFSSMSELLNIQVHSVVYRRINHSGVQMCSNIATRALVQEVTVAYI